MDEITRVLSRQGSECGWLAHLSLVSSQIQQMEFALLRRSAEESEKLRQASETSR